MGIFDNPKRYDRFFRNFKERFLDLQSVYGNVSDMEILVEDINFLVDSDYYLRLRDAHSLKDRIYEPGVLRKDFLDSCLIKKANYYLGSSSNPFKEITFSRFIFMHSFFEYFYYLNSNKPLSKEDMENIYYSNLVKQVILLLDDFDQEFNKDLDLFFEHLKDVKWQKESNKLFSKIDRTLLELKSYKKPSAFWSSLMAKEVDIAKFLCACSAASDNRHYVELEDVVRGYRTYFKLIKTDTTIYKAIPENKSYKPGKNSSNPNFQEKLKYFNNPDARLNVWLRVWGVLLIGFGVAIASLVKYPAYLIGSFFIIAGALSFLIVHRLMYIFYGFIMIGLAIVSYLMSYKLGSVSFILLSIFLFISAWRIGKKSNNSVNGT
jgi:hypothetical protein